MKKRFLSVSAIALACGILFSSCIGSFNLSNKLLNWNQSIDSKFVNEIVFVAFWIVPVYEVCVLADILVINSIEFWSGNNPVNVSEVKQVKGSDGIMYTIETNKNGYDIKTDDGKEMSFVYDKETQTWSYVSAEEQRKIFSYEDDKNVIVYMPDGSEKKVELSAQGTLAFKQSIMNSTFLAQK